MNATTNPSARPATLNPPQWPPRSAAERDRLRDQALAEAAALRRAAIADFWRGADAWFSGAVGHTRRAADRLAARLHQHDKQRGEASGCARAIES